jgi:hypothetical protein
MQIEKIQTDTRYPNRHPLKTSVIKKTVPLGYAMTPESENV